MEDKDEKAIYLRNPRIKQQLSDIKGPCKLFKIDYFSANELNARLAFTIGFFLKVKIKDEKDKADKWLKELMKIDEKERKAKEGGNVEKGNVEKENVEKGKEVLESALNEMNEKIDIPKEEEQNILALVNLMWNNRENKIYNKFPQFAYFEIQFANTFLNLDEVPTKVFYYNPLKQSNNEEESKDVSKNSHKHTFIFISYPITSKKSISANKSVILAIPNDSDEDKTNLDVKLIFPSMLNYTVPGRSEDYEIYLEEEKSSNELDTWAKSTKKRTKLFYKEVLEMLNTVLGKLKFEKLSEGSAKEALSEIGSLIEYINMINIKTLYDANEETCEIFEKHKKELKEAKLILENRAINSKDIEKIRSNSDLVSPKCGHSIGNVIDIRLNFIASSELRFLICKTCGEIVDNFTLNKLLGRHIKEYMDIIAKKWPYNSCMLCHNYEYYLDHDMHKLCDNCAKKNKDGKCPIPFCNKEIEKKEENNSEASIPTNIKVEEKEQDASENKTTHAVIRFNNPIEEDIDKKSNIKDVKREKSNSYSNKKIAKEFKCPKGHLMLRCGVKEKFTHCLECMDTEDYEGKIEYICRLCLKNKKGHIDQDCYKNVIKSKKIMCGKCLYLIEDSNLKECYFCGANIKDNKDHIIPKSKEEIEKAIKKHFIVD